MLTCIICSKQRTEDEGEDDEVGSVNTKDGVKALTTQIQDMAFKVSGGHKDKPGCTQGRFKGSHNPYPNINAFSEGMVSYTYPQPKISINSTPTWDFTKIDRQTTPPASIFSSFANDNIATSLEHDESVLEEDDEPREWTAQVEPGVQITFVSLPGGGNDLKRIRFSRETFDKWQAQRWWGGNFDRVMELYNVQRFNQQIPYTPARSNDGRDSTYSKLESARESPRMTPWVNQDSVSRYRGKSMGETSSCAEEPRMTTSSSVSITNPTEIEAEWIEEDEPGVYITIRQLIDGTRELRRVRFSREMFGEVRAKQWWETNRDRVQEQYLIS